MLRRKYKNELLRYRNHLKIKSPHTERCANSTLNNFFDFMDEFGINEINKQAVQSYTDYISTKNEPITVRTKANRLKTFFGFVDIDINFKKILLPKCIESEKDIPDERIMRRYFDEAQKSRSRTLKALLGLLPRTGLRISEICGDPKGNVPGIRKKDIVRRDNEYHLYITGKFGKKRMVPMRDKVKEILLNRLRLPGLENDDKLFNITPDAVRKKMRRIKNKLGVEWLTPHTMRHVFVTAMIESGAPLSDVQKTVGHVNIATTGRYTHSSLRKRREYVMNMRIPGDDER